ncbi:MAG: hypothetical protein JRH11_26015, partial [Deltaproteobacteria bacterium]|nr:hypothetical protein [Deltaproteobacteria bacterium]
MHRLASLVVLVLGLAGCGDSADELDSGADGSVGRDSAAGDGALPADAATDAPAGTCGDLVCASDETCSACEVDCGACEVPPVTECNDGVDNDGDGLLDWQHDVGCWGEGDATEASRPRDEEGGWTTFDLAADSRLIYVSADGDDGNDGLSPETAVATPRRGAELVRDGFPDFLLFRRGDTWRSSLSSDRIARRFKSGRSATERLVISSYGDSALRPRFEVEEHFLDDDGHGRSNLAIVGLAFVSYRKSPGDADFNGADGG